MALNKVHISCSIYLYQACSCYNLSMKKEACIRVSSAFKQLITSCQNEVDVTETSKQFAHLNEQELQHLHTLAHQHGVYPLFYQTLKSIQLKPTQEHLKNIFKKSNMQITQQNMFMSAELLQLMQLFKQNTLQAMAFKGPALSAFAYGNVTLRQYGDLDILIQRADIERSLELLIKRGYTPEIALANNNVKTFYNCVNVIGLQKGPIRVEIHWELLSKNYAIDWDETNLWSDHETVTINSHPVNILSFHDLILYLCAHGSKHLFERLEWICDIDRAIRAQKEIDWNTLLEKAKTYGIERMLLLGLSLAHHFFSLPLPHDLSQKIKADQEVEPLIKKIISMHYSEQKQEKSYSTFWLLWKMRENLSDRLRFAYRGLFAPKFDDFKFIQLPKQLSFLYPLIRPYRLITKYFKN